MPRLVIENEDDTTEVYDGPMWFVKLLFHLTVIIERIVWFLPRVIRSWRQS